MKRATRLGIGAVLVGGLLLAGCGSSSGPSTSGATLPAVTLAPTTTTTTQPPGPCRLTIHRFCNTEEVVALPPVLQLDGTYLPSIPPTQNTWYCVGKDYGGYIDGFQHLCTDAELGLSGWGQFAPGQWSRSTGWWCVPGSSLPPQAPGAYSIAPGAIGCSPAQLVVDGFRQQDDGTWAAP
jgi:hypothetical protein